MSRGALIFMLCTWTAVIGLAVWSYSRLLRAASRRKKDPPPGESPQPPGLNGSAAR